jgi:hypothetical protein
LIADDLSIVVAQKKPSAGAGAGVVSGLANMTVPGTGSRNANITAGNGSRNANMTTAPVTGSRNANITAGNGSRNANMTTGAGFGGKYKSTRKPKKINKHRTLKRFF